MQSRKRIWSSVPPLDHIYVSEQICDACFHIITRQVFESNGNNLVPKLLKRHDIHTLLDAATHVGRTDAAPLLAGLVAAGCVEKRHVEWIRELGALCAAHRRLKIDPLMEAARLVLIVRIVQEVRRG